MKGNDDQFSEEEIARRRDEAIRRALRTPPTPFKKMVGKTERAKTQRHKTLHGQDVAPSRPHCESRRRTLIVAARRLLYARSVTENPFQ
jgi:hypothetical protein